MEVIKPNTSLKKYKESHYSIFLAGSIEMGTAENWQNFVIDRFKEKKELVFFNPRRDNWNSSWEQKESNPHFNYQVNWELHHLEKADLIFMYLSPNTKSPISLMELGLYAGSDKLIVCCPDGFWRKGNVDIVCSNYGIKLYNTLDSAIGHLVTLLHDVN